LDSLSLLDASIWKISVIRAIGDFVLNFGVMPGNYVQMAEFIYRRLVGFALSIMLVM